MLSYIESTSLDATKQVFEVQAVNYYGESAFQKILVFTNKFYGKILILDGVLQLSEYDEYLYHEMIAHIQAGYQNTGLHTKFYDPFVHQHCFYMAEKQLALMK